MRVLCFGAMNMDKLAHCHRPFQQAVSNPVTSRFTAGGVGFNIARTMKKLGIDSHMVSCVGDDPDGRYLLDLAKKWQMSRELIEISKTRLTATYTAVLDTNGELAVGLSEMDIYERLTVERLEPQLSKFQEFDYWIIEANIPQATIDWLVEHKGDSQIFAAPVSVIKSERWMNAIIHVDFWISNRVEAEMVSGIKVKDLESAHDAATLIAARGPKQVVITLGAEGVYTLGAHGEGYWTIPQTRVYDVNGAGDSFFAALCASHISGESFKDSIDVGLAVASLTTEYDGPVCEELTSEMVKQRLQEIPQPRFFNEE